MMLKVLSFVCVLALCHSLPSPEGGKPEEVYLDNISAIYAKRSVKPTQTAPCVRRESPEKKGEEKCTIPEGTQGICVPYNLCAVQDMLFKDIDDYQYDGLPLKSYCKSDLEVCCEKKPVTKDPLSSTKEPAISEAFDVRSF